MVEATRPNATLTKELVQRAKRTTNLSNGNGIVNNNSGSGRRGSSMTNLFMKTMGVEYPKYFITKKALPLGRRLDQNTWRHLAWSVAIFPDQIVLLMTVDGGEQFTMLIPLENGLQTTKTSSYSLLAIGEVETEGHNQQGGYGITGVLLFRKSIPEVQILAELMSYGPDLVNPGIRCQMEQIVSNRGLISRSAEDLNTPLDIDAGQVLRETIFLSFTAQNLDLVLSDGEPVGSMSFGAKLTPIRNRNFATNLIVSGGLDVLLYLFARVVELKASSRMQALALRTVLEAAHRNMTLFSDFKRRHGDAISSVLRAQGCDKSLRMLKIILDVAFDGQVLQVADEGTTYRIGGEGNCHLLYPELIISTVNNFDAWVDEKGDESVIEVLFEVMLWLNVSSVGGGAFSKRQLQQANVLGAILDFCKMHVGGISSRIRVTRPMAERLVELLGAYGPTPPGADFLDELAKLLLLIQEPSCVFVTQDRVNYYYLLAACPPDKMGLKRKATERWANGWMFQRRNQNRRQFDSMTESSSSRSSSVDGSLWRQQQRGASKEDLRSVAGGAMLVAGEEVGKGKKDRNGGKRRSDGEVISRVMEVAIVKDEEKWNRLRVESKDVVRLSKVVHNKKVAQRRRTIERRTPLYNRLRAHVWKKDNGE